VDVDLHRVNGDAAHDADNFPGFRVKRARHVAIAPEVVGHVDARRNLPGRAVQDRFSITHTHQHPAG
jgi:hypothetical protein